MIVIDSSAVVHAYTNPGPLGEAARERIEQSAVLVAPHLLDVEVASALCGMARGIRGGTPKLTQQALDAALTAYAALPVRRYEHLPLLPRIRQLIDNMSAYDATYVALAEAMGIPLVTSDARIAGSGAARCEIEVVAG